jgi:hypothetical protein
MIHEILDPKFVRDRVTDLGHILKKRTQQFPQSDAAIRSEAARHGITSNDLQVATEVVADLAARGNFTPSEEEAAWLPRDPYLSIVQSALEDFYRQADAVDEPAQHGLADTVDPVTSSSLKADWIPSRRRPFMRQTEESDWLGWALSFAVAKGVAGVRGKPAFPVQTDTVRLGTKARLILVGDWASGVPRAARVAAQMEKQLQHPDAADRDCHVIHLGDVYYAGRAFEYEARLGSPWPVSLVVADRVGSWCLNGNHDMFSGGHGFFDFLRSDARFRRQNRCSYFALENDDWLIFGLDTAYTVEGFKGDLGGLAAPQSDWIKKQVDRAPGKKIMLLTHHQPFSAWEEESPKLVAALDPLLKRSKPVEAWFWGHEHRCAVYAPSHNVKYPALIGHGGVPVYFSSRAPKGEELRYYDQRNFSHLLEKFSFMGFAVVDLDGAAGRVRYIDENGVAPWEVDSLG